MMSQCVFLRNSSYAKMVLDSMGYIFQGSYLRVERRIIAFRNLEFSSESCEFRPGVTGL